MKAKRLSKSPPYYSFLSGKSDQIYSNPQKRPVS
jgi:hypothetical protein